MRVDVEAMGWCDAARGTVAFCDLPHDGVSDAVTAGRTQVARCSVEGIPVLIAHALLPVLRGEERAALVTLLARDGRPLLAFVTEARQGYCRCETLAAEMSAQDASTIAAAAAVVHASWAWDESDGMIVAVDAREFRIAPRHEARGWVAETR
jgi:hypothetical protein